jgi:tetratricopeptide (TPR) repeat protein
VSSLKPLLLLVIALSLCAPLSGCFKKWDYDEVQEWYEKQPESFDDYMQFAREKAAQGKSERAVELYEEGMRQAEWQFGPDDSRIATAADELGHFQEKKAMYGAAEQNYRRSLEIRLKSQSPTSLDVIRTKKALSGVLQKLFKGEEAQQLLDEVSGRGKRKKRESTSSKPAKRVRRHTRHSSPE